MHTESILEELHKLAALRKAVGKAGPWTWDFRPQGKSISLFNGWDTVLDVVRWGFQGASIRMEDPENPGCLSPIHEDAVPHPGRNHHKDWALTANPARPAAAFIAAAGSFDFAAVAAALTATPAPAKAAVVPPGYALVPLVASEALLASMAMRSRHDYGLWDAEKQAGARLTMRQVHEEVVGTGCYRAALAAAPAAPEAAPLGDAWVAVGERLPADWYGTLTAPMVLIARPAAPYVDPIAVGYLYDGEWFVGIPGSDENLPVTDVTHWQPLPTPPADAAL